MMRASVRLPLSASGGIPASGSAGYRRRRTGRRRRGHRRRGRHPEGRRRRGRRLRDRRGVAARGRGLIPVRVEPRQALPSDGVR